MTRDVVTMEPERVYTQERSPTALRVHLVSTASCRYFLCLPRPLQLEAQRGRAPGRATWRAGGTPVVPLAALSKLTAHSEWAFSLEGLGTSSTYKESLSLSQALRPPTAYAFSQGRPPKVGKARSTVEPLLLTL